MIKQIQINKIKEVILKNENGFTLRLTTLKPYEENKGYAVAITNLKGKQINHLIKKVLFISKAFKQIEKNLFIGGWKDKENNFYLDLTLIIKEDNLSLNVAKLFNQKAIYSFMGYQEIYLK